LALTNGGVQDNQMEIQEQPMKALIPPPAQQSREKPRTAQSRVRQNKRGKVHNSLNLHAPISQGSAQRLEQAN